MHPQHDHHHHGRLVFGVGVAILLALMALLLALPSRTEAAPRHNHGLTITSTPDPITAGQGVLIYGRLTGPNNAYKRVWLFHRINPADRFTPVSVTRTNASGLLRVRSRRRRGQIEPQLVRARSGQQP